MSEIPAVMPNEAEAQVDLLFDDRVDTQSDISSAEAIALMGRSMALLKEVKGLFACKFVMALVSMFPVLLVPWVGKIVIDQVLLQSPLGESGILFPPFLDPFLSVISDMSPMGIMAVIVLMYGVLLILFGTRGPGVVPVVVQGEDAATQSEAALSAGGSSAGGLWGTVEALINVRLTQRISNSLRTRLFERLSRLPMTTLDDQRIGDSVYRIMYDAPQVPNICFYLTLMPVVAVLGSLISLSLMQYSYGEVAPQVVWVASAMLPIGLLATIPLSGIVRRLNQRSRASGAATTNAVEESMNNITAVQSLGGMDREKERFAARSAESFKRHRFAYAMEILLFILGYACIIGAALYVTILISNEIITGTMTPGDFWTLFGLYSQLGGAALGVGMFWIQLQRNVAAIRRVFFFIDYDSARLDIKRPALAPLKENIRLDQVDYTYPDGRRALTNISLEMSPGELVAIVGPTGAGKTSLAYLLPGFLQPTRGRVLFDGVDITETDTKSLRSQVSYVFQEHMLLSESIRENFLLAKPDATDEEIIEACRDAGATEFIDRLPNGIDTILGRSGDTLSVGQKQRLCIARGLIRQTAVLILDEPTAALDPKTENALVESLLTAAQGRLVIVIAHRLSTIRRADRIIFLEDGQIKDIGSHEQLMTNSQSSYRRFVALQSG
jgi:ATP-binding cassette subfamily B protein